MSSRPLPYIIALARMGSLSRAWALFEAGGYLARRDDPAALSVKGRLLKDRALRAAPAERVALLSEAAAAYLTADRLQAEPYRLINAASLSAMAGDVAQSRTLAAAVLARLDGPDPVAETPYYIEATRAEALLLLGDVPAAATALRQAIAVSPGNWSDLAGTLKQLRLICIAAGLDPAWLDPMRPPRSLHFVGHMGFIAGGAAEQALAERVDRLIHDDNIGFAYGALAAGADIIIAERVVAAGRALHVVLPTPVEAFARDSVDPAGPLWRSRFEGLVERAKSLHSVTRYRGGHDSDATCLANEYAMGLAVLNAQQLASEALQLAVLDEDGGGPHSARLADHWRVTGRRHIVEMCPRDLTRQLVPSVTGQAGRRRCRAGLYISLVRSGAGDDDGLDKARRLGALVADVSAQFAPADVSVSPWGWHLRYPHPKAAAQCAFALRRRLEAQGDLSPQVGMAGHYGVKEVIFDAASRTELDYDLGGTDDDAVTQWIVPGSLTVSGAFVAALSVDPTVAFHAEPLGEQDDDVGRPEQLFALEPAFRAFPI